MKMIFLCERDEISRVYPASVRDALIASGADGKMYCAADLKKDPEKFRAVEAIFSTWGMPVLKEEEIRTCLPNLKYLFYAAGSVQAFARPFLNCGVRVFSAWGANAVPVMEYALSQILLANAGYFHTSALFSSGDHSAAKKIGAQFPGNYGAKVGLLGVGMIGSLLAEKLKGFHLDVLAFDPFLLDEKAEKLGVKKVGLEELFASCQVVSNHMANNEKTRGMLGETLFASMRPYAVFLNTGRGAQVREDELCAVLRRRPDLYAVLDVTFPEPPEAGHPFYALPNVILTPHIAGSKGDEVHRMAQYMLEAYESVSRGAKSPCEVTMQMLETMA